MYFVYISSSIHSSIYLIRSGHDRISSSILPRWDLLFHRCKERGELKSCAERTEIYSNRTKWRKNTTTLWLKWVSCVRCYEPRISVRQCAAMSHCDLNFSSAVRCYEPLWSEYWNDRSCWLVWHVYQKTLHFVHLQLHWESDILH